MTRCPDCPPALEARAWAFDTALANIALAVLPFAITVLAIVLVYCTARRHDP